MSNYNLSPVGNWFSTFGSNTAGSSSNAPLAGGLLWTYSAGTTTPLPTYTGSNGIIANTNPIVLGSDGRPPAEIWLTAGYAYKFVLQDSLGNPIPNGTYDNIVGINDTGISSSNEWTATGFGATYSSTNIFSTSGNSTGYYQVGRRVQASVSAGLVYGTVVSSSYTTATTVTLVMDPGMALDSGLTLVNVGILNGTHPSIPAVYPYPMTFNSGLSASTVSATTSVLGTASANSLSVSGATALGSTSISSLNATSLAASSGATVPTVSAGDNSTNAATTAFVSALVGGTSAATSSLAASGYQKLPSGLILQWGSASGSTGTVTYPVAFTTFSVPIVSSTGAGYAYTSSSSLTGFGFATTGGITWFAIGK